MQVGSPPSKGSTQDWPDAQTTPGMFSDGARAATTRRPRCCSRRRPRGRAGDVLARVVEPTLAVRSSRHPQEARGRRLHDVEIQASPSEGCIRPLFWANCPVELADGVDWAQGVMAESGRAAAVVDRGARSPGERHSRPCAHPQRRNPTVAGERPPAACEPRKNGVIIGLHVGNRTPFGWRHRPARPDSTRNLRSCWVAHQARGARS